LKCYSIAPVGGIKEITGTKNYMIISLTDIVAQKEETVYYSLQKYLYPPTTVKYTLGC